MPNSPLLDYLKEDRQWPRRHRIAHAQAVVNTLTATTPFAAKDATVKFYNQVLKANGAKR
jgi:hypothetical protein